MRVETPATVAEGKYLSSTQALHPVPLPTQE